jgi:hypothetical protein
MKVIHITHVFWEDWGYQENFITSIQAANGLDVIVIAPIRTVYDYNKNVYYNTGIYYHNNVKIYREDFSFNILNKFYKIKNLIKILNNEKPDIIMLHGMQSLNIFDCIKYKTINKSVKLYSDIHSDFDISSKNFISKLVLHKIFWKKILKYSEKYFEAIFYTRPSVLEFINEVYDLNKKRVFPLYLGSIRDSCLNESSFIENKAKFISSHKLPNNSILFLTGGKIDKNRNIEIICKTIYSSKLDNVVLIVFGSINELYFDEFNILLNKYKFIKYLGWQSNASIKLLFCSVDLSIFLGNHSVLWEESVCHGSPLVINYKQNREYLDLGGNVFFLNNNDNIQLESFFNGSDFLSETIKMRQVAINFGMKFDYIKITEELHSYFLN